ncbi:MAG: carbohydrate kinase family protein [Micrococcales bacterium]|nr:carbohydrate kinase family protein [Micrococcales bacterium]
MADLAVVAGHICLDLFPTLTGTVDLKPGNLSQVGALSRCLGGSVANTGNILARLGLPVNLQACVGDDWLGEVVSDLANQLPVKTGRITAHPGATTSYSLVIEPPGCDRTFWHHPGANDHFDPAAVSLADARFVHVGYPPLLAACLENDGARLASLYGRARDGGITTSMDLAVVDSSMTGTTDWGQWLARMGPLTSVISPSRDDLVSMLDGASSQSAQELAWFLVSCGFAVAMVTDGAKGLYLAVADEARLQAAGAMLAAVASSWAGTGLWVPAKPVESIVTTNGAGDAATAGLLTAIWQGTSPERAAQLAADVAAQHLSGRFAPSTLS